MKKTRIVIIDYGSGNLKSVYNAIFSLNQLNCEVVISQNSEDLVLATHIILPGVGAFGDCMDGISRIPNLINKIKEHIISKPFLGICVGMQLLADFGYENGKRSGLGFIRGEIKKLNSDNNLLKIPHIGWNDLQIVGEHKILNGIKNEDHAYFVHSYYFDNIDSKNILATCKYGSNIIPAIINKGNIFATQFHPEKSSGAGLRFLENFIKL
jgi:glutamine amidotransferase